MKMTMSVAFASARGKAGDVVGAIWKGRQYIRRRVIPANPRSLGQRTTRWSMKNVVEWWKTFSSTIKANWSGLAEEAAVSNFNSYTGANVQTEIATFSTKITPANELVGTMAAFAAVSGGLSGEIDLSWTAGEATAGDEIVIAYHLDKGAVPADVKSTAATVLVLNEATGAVVSDLAFTITGLTPGATYVCYALARDAADGDSLSLAAQAVALA